MQIGEEIVQLQLMSWGGHGELSHMHATLESHMVHAVSSRGLIAVPFFLIVNLAIDVHVAIQLAGYCE